MRSWLDRVQGEGKICKFLYRLKSLGIKTFARECTFVNAHKICLFSYEWEHVPRYFWEKKYSSYKVLLTPMTQIMTLYNSNA